MKKTIGTVLTIASFIIPVMVSCVSQKEYEEIKELQAAYYDEARLCKYELEENQKLLDELNEKVRVLSAQKEKMQADTLRLVQELERVQSDCGLMQKQNEELITRLKGSKSADEVASLMEEIQTLQNELINRENALFKAERNLNDKQKELEIKNARINELTALLDSTRHRMNSLKDSLRAALTSYQADGLEVYYKNGRIYVSLAEQLLFRTARWDVDDKGAAAIRELSQVLANHPDINITVEGHTDNNPYAGSGNIVDNWDLSCKRSTAIIRILLENRNLSPARVSAAGRAEYCPVDSAGTATARKKNRRSEIILTPDVEKFMEIIR